MHLSLISTAISPPILEPISLDQAKMQLRIESDNNANDVYLAELLIPAVRERAEMATDRALITQTWDLWLDHFPCDDFIEIPKPPLQTITHVKYKDTDGVLQTWAVANYVVQAPAGPRCRRGRISLAYGKSWPATYGQEGDIEIRFVAGYGLTGDDVPYLLKMAMLLDIGTLDADRENLIKGRSVQPLPGGARDIYASFRSWPRQRL